MKSAPELDPGWLRRLDARIDAPPANPRSPLLLLTAGEARGATIGSIESELALQLAAAGYPLRDAGSSWNIELPASRNGCRRISTYPAGATNCWR
jgi:hypothetical protein